MPTPDIKRTVELDAVTADALWACRFVMSLARNPQKLSVAAMFSTFNYLSLFRYESLNYLRKNRPDIVKLLPQTTTGDLERSRNTIKLFDVHEHVDGVVGYFSTSVQMAHSQHFLGNTWLPIARRLEKDLGFTFYGSRVVYTTHGAAFILGVEPSELLKASSRELMNASEKYGQHFGVFWNRVTDLGPSFVDKLDVKRVRTQDVRAANYYGSHFNGSGTPGINALLYVFLSSLNFLDVMLRLDLLPESRQTVLKLQFITLYHVTSSLKKLRNKHQVDLSQQSLDYIDQALGDVALGSVMGGTSRYFRNTLIHYGLGPGVQEGELDPAKPCYGLIEKYIPGHDYASLSTVVTEQVARLSTIFNEWERR